MIQEKARITTGNHFGDCRVHESGLYYLQSRYYDPVVGRFLNADALFSTGQGILGNNMFAYCLNNPVDGYDEFGLCKACDRGAWGMRTRECLEEQYKNAPKITLSAGPYLPDFVSWQIEQADYSTRRTTTDRYAGEIESSQEGYRVFVYQSYGYEIVNNKTIFDKVTYYYFKETDIAKKIRTLEREINNIIKAIGFIEGITTDPYFYSTPKFELVMLGVSSFQYILIIQWRYLESEKAYYEALKEDKYVLQYYKTVYKGIDP